MIKVLKYLIQAGFFFVGRCRGQEAEEAYGFAWKLFSDYRSAGLKSFGQVRKLHKNGFFLPTAREIKLNDEKMKDCLNDFDYLSIHPLNGLYTLWIDDKLTFRHVFSKYRDHIPKYYFHIDRYGNILDAVDLPEEFRTGAAGGERVLALLRREGRLFAKEIAGSLSKGTMAAEYRDGAYYLNGSRVSGEDILERLAQMREYIVQQHISPNREIPSCFTTIRLMVIHEPGEEASIEFAMIYTMLPGVRDTRIDIETGEYQAPDSRQIYRIPWWQEIKAMAADICRDFPELCYMGIDIGLSDENFYMYEINSMSQIQEDYPYMAENSPLRPFFEKKLKEAGRR